MAPSRAPLKPELLSRFGELLPKCQRERASVHEFLQQAQGDLPLPSLTASAETPGLPG
jgi:hypothetical protein